ncbi:hypothetical protein ADIS_1184 [Lunatimonas lonarensis]|uniref:Uncharacterized protein n=1 Tax=Lunatimonas lonarensis TaxID=1232681 RepID=R7ZVZ7_9BACT|nr:hypothetical protein ADIS_1184 [Lunatimonas lonarensis]
MHLGYVHQTDEINIQKSERAVLIPENFCFFLGESTYPFSFKGFVEVILLLVSVWFDNC